jgi:hypothetical protein
MPLVSPFVWSPQGYSATAADEIKAATDKVTSAAASCTSCQGDHAVEKQNTHNTLHVPTISDFLFLDDLFCDMMACFPIVDTTTTDQKKEPLPLASLHKYTNDYRYSYGKFSWDETSKGHHSQRGSLQVQ